MTESYTDEFNNSIVQEKKKFSSVPPQETILI